MSTIVGTQRYIMHYRLLPPYIVQQAGHFYQIRKSQLLTFKARCF